MRLPIYRPMASARPLDLYKPIYQRTASYGHFGRDPEAMAGLAGKPWIWWKG